MAKHNELGKWGEDKAEEYLRRKGYRILERDWRSGHLDLDIIAATDDGTTLVIVEVKTRTSKDLKMPEEAVDRRKILHLQKAADAYVKLRRVNANLRFDIIAITGNTDATMQLNHIENAFTPIPVYRY